MSRNLIKHALPKLTAELYKHSGYSLLLVGYSLGTMLVLCTLYNYLDFLFISGAGLAHLFMMDLKLGGANQSFPPGTKLRAITYGCPPVFTSPCGNVAALSNILMISNNNDGITGASLKCMNDIFLKTKAIQKLNLQRRTLLKMAFNKSSSSSANDADLVADALQEMEMPEEKEKEKAVVPSGLFSNTRARVSNQVSKVKGVSATLDVWDQVIIIHSNLLSPSCPQPMSSRFLIFRSTSPPSICRNHPTNFKKA